MYKKLDIMPLSSDPNEIQSNPRNNISSGPTNGILLNNQTIFMINFFPHL